MLWVAENGQSFNIVNDWQYKHMMRTGRISTYIPLVSTLSRDVQLNWMKAWHRLKKELQVHDTTDQNGNLHNTLSHRQFKVMSTSPMISGHCQTVGLLRHMLYNMLSKVRFIVTFWMSCKSQRWASVKYICLNSELTCHQSITQAKRSLMWPKES